MIVRIRLCEGRAGGRHHYWHADVVCTSESEALIAAEEGRVRNWRLVDSFDWVSKSYRRFEIIAELDEHWAERPAAPAPRTIIEH